MVRLGSSSITRAKILKENNIDFIQSASNFDEDIIKESNPLKFVKIAALGKYRDLYKKYGVKLPLIVADSVVSCNNQILRKANSIDEAKKMLLMQSNNQVSIITCTIFCSINSKLVDISTTTYEFSEFNKLDLEKYLDSNEWVGKAGAIMVEGFAKKYIKSAKGLESTARGLTIEKILPLIRYNK